MGAQVWGAILGKGKKGSGGESNCGLRGNKLLAASIELIGKSITDSVWAI